MVAILAAWQPPDPTPFEGGRQNLEPRHLSAALLAVTSTAPPPSSPGRSPALQAEIVGMWQPEAWPFVWQGASQPYARRSLNANFEAVRVDGPPFSHEGRNAETMAIVLTWQTPDPAQPMPRRLVQPGGAVAPAAQPTPPLQIPLVLAWQPAPLQPIVAAPGVVQSVAASPPPFDRRYAENVASVLAAWRAADPSPFEGAYQALAPRVLNASLTAVRVDAPPPDRRQPETAAAVLRAWQPPDPPPQAPAKLSPAAEAVKVDAPPPSSSATLNAILASWRPPDAQAPIAGKVSPAIAAVPVSLPPPSSTAAMRAIIDAWQPGAPLLLEEAPGTAPIVPIVTVTNPPPPTSFAVMAEIVMAWQPPPPALVPRPTPMVRSEAAASFVQPPPSPQPPAILLAWQAVDPMPSAARPLSPALRPSADQPPAPRQPPAILQAWQLDPPPPTLTQRVSGLFAVRVDSPPPLRSIASILDAWQPPAPPPWVPRYLPPIPPPPVNPPPIRTLATLNAILASWQAGDPPVQQRRAYSFLAQLVVTVLPNPDDTLASPGRLSSLRSYRVSLIASPGRLSAAQATGIDGIASPGRLSNLRTPPKS